MILSTQVYLHFHWAPHTTKLCWPTISPSTSDPSHFTDNLMKKLPVWFFATGFSHGKTKHRNLRAENWSSSRNESWDHIKGAHHVEP